MRLDKTILDRAYWNAEGFIGPPTLPRFIGEFEHSTGILNQNQLAMDMGTFQSQLRALGIYTILWGGTYADGSFEIFSSHWRGDTVRNLDLTDNVVLYTAAIQQICISSHRRLSLTDPVNFLMCYSFMCNVALDTVQFLNFTKRLLSSTNKVILSMKAMAWRVSNLPSTVSDTKSKAPSTIDVRTSHKHRKPASDSDRGSGNGRTDRRSRSKRAKKEEGNVHEDAQKKNGHSGAHEDGKGKTKDCARGSGEDDDSDFDSQASGGSAIFSEEWGIEGRMARQRKAGQQDSLLEAHAILHSAMMPMEGPFHEIEKWRSSIAV